MSISTVAVRFAKVRAHLESAKRLVRRELRFAAMLEERLQVARRNPGL